MLIMDESFEISKLVFDKKIELKIRSNPYSSDISFRPRSTSPM